MKLVFTVTSTNENKSIMDVIAQVAAESLEQRHEEREPSSHSGGFKSFVRGKLIKGAARTVELIGSDAVNSVFSMLKPKLGRIINENLQQNDIAAVFLVEDIVKEDEKMKVTVNLESINYTRVINRFLPEIIRTIRDGDPSNYLWKIYDVISDDQPRIVKAVMDTISDAKKEEIIEMMILQNKDLICDKISGLLTAQNIAISVDNIYVIPSDQSWQVVD